MGSVDMRAVPYCREMIAELAELGFNNTVVLEAMATVPRHRFVDRFWATPPGKPWTSENVREFRVTDDTDNETLGLLYRANTALMTRGPLDRPGATSALSAPIIVALMAAELDLRPGLNVLEIGTGSGYHAAVMAALVGDPGLVTTVDIDPTVISETAARFGRLGLSAMNVRCRDGASGAADKAPFDRIVATVGCADLSPAWVDQLANDGQILVPLEHGSAFPRVLVRQDQGLIGRFVGHSNFIPIRGQQDLARPRPRVVTTVDSSTEPAPTDLLAAMAPPDPSRSWRTPGTWNFATYLALRDRRATAGPALAENTSLAGLRNTELVVAGSTGTALKDRFLELADDWLLLGAPGIGQYAITFTPLPSPAEDRPANRPAGPWHIDRISYRQTTTLNPSPALPA